MDLGAAIHNQVFINCPFDDEYRDLLRPMLFMLCYLKFIPRIASEFLNSAQNRIDKICELIEVSDYSIHDLSRCKSLKEDEYVRMNMPFELGIDYGNYYFLRPKRKILILEGKRYDTQKALSDLAGVDVKCHSNVPENVVKCIRDWMLEALILGEIDSPTTIWYKFMDFTFDFYNERKTKGFKDKDLNDMPIPEYISSIIKWLTT